ncbi:hypothetical protein SR1949_16640 [Sphaerospermopsis reniformis]|jgi:hypothetical protein|uniref:Uncharacterized protein n=3 Tax=Sphaerospermopsis TaxID=752201 RepID=A0A479ZUX5_9CYAN|nr:hypothetical protein NIES73_02180 [Sphaerospermopsis kisseleviana NIES-73]GCL36560.1 hypothetical protein SR1949_16640 [Sphaerospermopsis reniformis]
MFMINHYSIEWIEAWCMENGWTDLFMERRGNYWAFPPGGVMPEPIPVHVLRLIKEENGLTNDELFWSITAVVITILSVIYTFVFKCPMPLVFAFAFNAVTVAQLEPEYD